MSITEVSGFIPDDWTPADRPREDMKLLLEIQGYNWARLREMHTAAGRATPKEVEFYEYTIEKFRQLVVGLETGKLKLIAVRANG